MPVLSACVLFCCLASGHDGVEHSWTLCVICVSPYYVYDTRGGWKLFPAGQTSGQTCAQGGSAPALFVGSQHNSDNMLCMLCLHCSQELGGCWLLLQCHGLPALLAQTHFFQEVPGVLEQPMAGLCSI